MAPIHFILGMVAVLVLCWIIHRSNRRRGGYVRRPADVLRENSQLRHVIAEQAIDRHHPYDRR
jgi:hypothetical protein